jgi:hypothetical protein
MFVNGYLISRSNRPTIILPAILRINGLSAREIAKRPAGNLLLHDASKKARHLFPDARPFSFTFLLID